MNKRLGYSFVFLLATFLAPAAHAELLKVDQSNSGRLSLEQGRQRLRLASGERYRLAAEEGNQAVQQQLQSLNAGQRLRITGQVPTSDPEAPVPLPLYAQRLEVQSTSSQ